MHYEKVGSEIRCIETEIPFEVPKNWVWTRIGSLFNLQSGKFISASEIHDVPDSIFRYACYGGNGIRGYADHYNREGSFPLIGRQGALCGNINHADGRFYATEHAIVVEHFCEINIEWMCYFLSQLNLNQYSTATAQPGLSVTTINSIPIPLPPHKEQLSIADAISHAFTQIDIVEQGKLDLQSIIAQTKSKILDLAIRGKLVPQDPDDEPASVLLECIRAEKEQLIKAGKIKRDKNESYIFRGDDKSYYQDKGGKRLCVEEMIPFDLPQQWLWCQLGEICDYGNCNNTDTATLPDDAWILDLEDIEKDTGKVLQRITVAKRKSNSTKHAFYNGQLLYSKLRPYLNKVLIADDDGYCTSEILPLEFANIIFPPYARHVLMSTYFLGYANQCSYGVKMPRLGTNDGKRAWIPLPPLSEQHRIAAAVDAAFAQLDTIADALV